MLDDLLLRGHESMNRAATIAGVSKEVMYCQCHFGMRTRKVKLSILVGQSKNSSLAGTGTPHCRPHTCTSQFPSLGHRHHMLHHMPDKSTSSTKGVAGWDSGTRGWGGGGDPFEKKKSFT